jgi:multiple sugar transport system substrate-binding protein
MSHPTVSRRGFLAGGASALTLAALTACGGSGGGGADELRMLTPIFDGPDGKQLLEKLLSDFSAKNNGVKVQADYTDYDHLNEKLTTSIASGRPYDVMLMGVGWVPPFASKGVLGDLGESPASLTRTYNARVVQPGVYKNKMYALPIMLDTRFGIYRKDIFAQAGITAPPKNFAEMRSQAKSLTVRGGGKLKRAGLDLLSLDLRQVFEPLLWANGGELFTPDLSAPAFNSPAGVGALQFMVDIIRTDKSEDFGFTKSGDVAIPLVQGRAAMMIGHNNVWTNIQKTDPELLKGDRLGTFVLNNTRPAIFQGGTLATMAAKSGNPEAAKALVEYLARPDIALQACAQRGNVPAAPSSLSSDYVKGNDFVRFAVENLGSSYSEGGIPGWLDIRSEFKATVESALLGEKAPKAALDELAAKASKIMAQG